MMISWYLQSCISIEVLTIARLISKLRLLNRVTLVMNVLEYNSGFDFIDMMNEFDYEYVKFMGVEQMVLTC